MDTKFSTIGKGFTDRVQALGVVDSYINPGANELERKFIQERAMYFTAASDPAGTPLPARDGVMTVSAGYPRHEYAPCAAIEAIFNFFAAHS